MKFNRDGGRVLIALSVERGFIKVTVRDTGIGIPEDSLPYIFQRFYRCDRSRSQEGTGLGLSLALAIARAHDGNIDVESEPGKGSIFTLTMPKAIL